MACCGQFRDGVTPRRYWAAHPTGHYRELHIIHHAADAFATATVVGAIEGVCRDMLKSADVVPNLLLLFPPAPAGRPRPFPPRRESKDV